MSIFNFVDYKDFFNWWLKSQPNKDKGILSHLAKKLEVNTTLMSLIFKGNSHLTYEQAIVTAQFLELTPLQTEYFIQLVSLDRTARKQAREYIEQKLNDLRLKAENLQTRLGATSELETKDYAQFFSHWIYTGLFLQVAIYDKIERMQLLNSFDCDKNLSHEALDFLIEKSVLTESNHKLSLGVTKIYIGNQSQFLRNHLSNWRQKGLEIVRDQNIKENIFYSCPIVISKKDVAVISEKLRVLIEDFNKIAAPSASEEMMCLNLDWFKV